MGLVMIPEGRRVFPNLTVEENLRLGAYLRKDKTAVKTDRDRCYDLFPRLKERARQHAGTLSGGEQQMLAVGRGLMAGGKILMLDEPSLGLAPLISKMIFDIIRELNRDGATVLLIEQNAHAALEIADYAYVLETGVITMHGDGASLLNNDRIRAAYLGEG
jgi:branched-chain amino acid transport system ATP-binding protein